MLLKCYFYFKAGEHACYFKSQNKSSKPKKILNSLEFEKFKNLNISENDQINFHKLSK